MSDQKTVTITLPAGQFASKVAAVSTGKLPPTWDPKSYPGYFKEEYGQYVKRLYDLMIADGNPRMIRYADGKGQSPTTIYLKFTCGRKYLLLYLDTEDKKYARFNSMVNVSKHRGVGIQLTIRKDANDMPSAEPISLVDEIPLWKQKITDYLENPNPTGEPLVINKLQLTPDEIATQKLELSGLAGIIYEVTSRQITIIKSV